MRGLGYVIKGGYGLCLVVNIVFLVLFWICLIIDFWIGIFKIIMRISFWKYLLCRMELNIINFNFWREINGK